MYPIHSLDLRVHIATFTWLGFVIDDSNMEISADLAQFERRVHSGEQQPSKLLQAFAKNLQETYRYYDPIVANFINLSALAFVNSCTIETRSEYQTMIPSKDAVNWPYYFRDKEGLPEVYTYFCFPRDRYPNMACFLPAVPDMCKFINLTNDILS